MVGQVIEYTYMGLNGDKKNNNNNNKKKRM